MLVRVGNLAKDLIVRTSGLLLLAVSALTLGHLYRADRNVTWHQASAIELGLAAIGFVTLSAGAASTILGSYLFSRIEVAGRWRKLPEEAQRSRLLAPVESRKPTSVSTASDSPSAK